MRRNVFTKTAPKVVCTLAMLFASNGSSAQNQRSPTEPQPHDVGWAPPTISEPNRPYLSDPSASGGLGSGSQGTTPILHESAKLTAFDAEAYGRVGVSVSLSGDTAFVGAPGGHFSHRSIVGSVKVFRFIAASWVEVQTLEAPDPVGFDFFGDSVSVSGDTAVVGAPRLDCAAGGPCSSAYVYRFNGASWVEVQALFVSDTVSVDRFGASVSLSGDAIVVGVPGVGDADWLAGAAYVYRFNGTNWVEEQKLIASDPNFDDQFGTSVSVSGDTAFVGAAGNDCLAGINCGSAYVFRFNGTKWVEEQKLISSEVAKLELFGLSVSVSGDTAVVGAHRNSYEGCAFCGAAYVFRFNGTIWIEEQKLIASDVTPSAEFGFSVTVHGDTVVAGVGCNAGSPCEAAYVFRFNGSHWVEQQKLVASVGTDNDDFGQAVSLSGNTVLVGADRTGCEAGNSCGAAYVFDLGPDELEISIDIKPGNDTNPVNLGARGVLPVAVLTTSVADGDLVDFDASDLDPSSLTLAGAAPRMKGRSGRVGSLADIDGDGDLDLLLHFPIAELELTIEDTEAVLLGQTFDGVAIRGSDMISAIHAQRIGADSLRRAE